MKTDMNVWEINAKIEELKNKEDLDPDLLADTIESLQLTRDEKLDSVANWIESNKAKTDWIDGKLKQLREVKQQLTNQNKRLNEYLTNAIDDAGVKSIQTKNHILKPRNYKASTIIENVEDLPIEYVTREEVIKPDKKKIYEDLKKGKEIPSAHLEENRKTVIQ